MKDFKAIPDGNTITEAAELEVFDVKGDKVNFGSIFAEEKTIVVFISQSHSSRSRRTLTGLSGHFFCGVTPERFKLTLTFSYESMVLLVSRLARCDDSCSSPNYTNVYR